MRRHVRGNEEDLLSMTTAHVARATANEISFEEILQRFGSRIWLIMSCGILGAAIGAAIAFTLKPIYRAEVLLSIVAGDHEGGLGSLSGQLGGLASLAGISVGQEGDRKVEAIATLQSRSLTEAFISDGNLLPILFANKWDGSLGKWKPSEKKQPSLWDGNKKFARDIRDVKDDKKSGLVTLAIEWTDPKVAAAWAKDLVERTNALLRKRAIERAESNIRYVQAQLVSASIVEVRQALFRLIENQIKVVMLAQSSSDYAFNVIDPAVAPEEKIRPNRPLIIALSTVGGLLFAALYALVRPKARKKSA